MSKPPGERELIRWLQQRAGTPQWPVLLGIGDDMASVEIGGDGRDRGTPVLITNDMLLDGVHFDSGRHSLEAIGRKAFACSLSDCAAMATRPVAAVVGVGWPAGTAVEQAKRLFEGMYPLAAEFGCPIVGGDTTSWQRLEERLVIDVAMIASVYPHHSPVRRGGGLAGDGLFVTGRLGGSLLGKHLTFTPRVREAHAIATSLGSSLHAMMDLSDGLSLDLHRMCEASGTGAQLVEELLEQAISEDARRASASDGVPALDHALSDGEDFELLLAVAGDAREPPTIEDAYMFPVGVVTESGLTIRLRDGSVRPLEPQGYEHLT